MSAAAGSTVLLRLHAAEGAGGDRRGSEAGGGGARAVVTGGCGVSAVADSAVLLRLQPPRALEEIDADLKWAEGEIVRLLREVVG